MKGKILNMSEAFVHNGVKKSVDSFFSSIDIINRALKSVQDYFPLTSEKYLELCVDNNLNEEDIKNIDNIGLEDDEYENDIGDSEYIEAYKSYLKQKKIENFDLKNLFDCYMLLPYITTGKMMSDVLFMIFDGKNQNAYETFNDKLRLFQEQNIIESKTMWEHFHGYQFSLLENGMVYNRDVETRVEILNEVYALCCHISSDSIRIKAFCNMILNDDIDDN